MTPLHALASLLVLGVPTQAADPPRGPIARIALPNSWQRSFWEDEDVEALLEMEPIAVADLVPEQAGLHFARCPACDETEGDDSLAWSVREPDKLTCRSCSVTFPNDTIPAKEKDAIPSVDVEVLPGVVHHYPYHKVDAAEARYPGERIYLDAKRDDRARSFLARFALYAAIAHRDDRPEAAVPKTATLAAVILLRFAQVYPAYAIHFDRPDRPKFLQPADLRPPYREGFASGKWEHSGALNVPMNLLIAYAILRDDPSIDEAGRLLGDPEPRRTIEDDLFRASAEFLFGHPDPHDEQSIYAARGLLAVGSVLGDDRLRDAGLRTLDALARRGFYHDGHWRVADPEAHQRVVAQVDGWFRGLLPTPAVAPDGRLDTSPGTSAAAFLALARRAGTAALVDPNVAEVNLVSWPPTAPSPEVRRPTLLGGVGLARLASGEGPGAIDLELRGYGDYNRTRFDRLSIRLAIGGRPVLGDLDDLSPSASGWERSSASHNLAIVDGLNQREQPAAARIPLPGSDIDFFAADPDLQIATLSDRRAYDQSTSAYRRIVAVIDDGPVRYAIDVFHVRGGHRHDLLYHAAPGTSARWRTAIRTERGPVSLLPPELVYVPNARAEDGRWFLQAYGAFEHLEMAVADRPTQAVLAGPSGPILRAHLLGLGRSTLYTADAPEPPSEALPGRGALIVRRESKEEAVLDSTFATLLEAPGRSGIGRVGRLASPEGTVVLAVETAAGVEHLVINRQPGTAVEVALSDGRPLQTDGLLVRVLDDRMVLAAGTFAADDDRRVDLERATGTIRAVTRGGLLGGRGVFEAEGPVQDPTSLAGRTLIVSHGGQASRAWTIHHVELAPDGHARIVVVEEPGFTIDPETGWASYYQFPGNAAPGPHSFIVSQIARSDAASE